jgi:DNA-binding transcriptional LysR family regulator
MAISSTAIQTPLIEWTELYTENLGVILSVDNPLASKEILSLYDLKDQKFICINANSDLQDMTRFFCERAGFTPNIYYEGDYPDLVGEAVSLGLGISLISEIGYRASKRYERFSWEKNITFRRLKETYCHRNCGVATLKNIYHSMAQKEFLNYVIRVSAESAYH